MSKILKFKAWLTLEAAAEYLSIVLEESIKPTDILQLGLEGHLKLSVYFMNEVTVKSVEVTPKTEGEMQELSHLNMKYEGSHLIEIKDNEIYSLSGVCDLPMIGGERFLVDQEYQTLLTGSCQNKIPPDYLYIEQDGQLFTPFDHLDNHFVTGIEDSDDIEGINRKANEQLYTEVFQWPDDTKFVIRRTSIDDFSKRYSATEKPLTDVERTTLLIIIAILAKKAKFDITKASAASIILHKDSHKLGTSIGASTIAEKLKLIPYLLEHKSSI